LRLARASNALLNLCHDDAPLIFHAAEQALSNQVFVA